ncbi:Ubp3 associated protein Bre5 [mine drainage metagenome]|uniref:Ubp3 associated protein Bre5 n=1 Tax=mine drainage metagenome TaxID=410659 RepID=A0A1J5PG72_9ZZZZ
MQHSETTFKLSLTSKAPLQISLEGTTGDEVTVKPDEMRLQRVYVTAAPGSAAAQAERTPLRIWVEDMHSTDRVEQDTIFFGKGK